MPYTILLYIYLYYVLISTMIIAWRTTSFGPLRVCHGLITKGQLWLWEHERKERKWEIERFTHTDPLALGLSWLSKIFYSTRTYGKQPLLKITCPQIAATLLVK